MRDVLALLPARVFLAPAHERLRADADSHDRVRCVHRPRDRDERAAVARHLLRRVAVSLGEHDDTRGEDEGGRHGQDDAAREPVSCEEGNDEHGAEEGDEARLGVGEVEPDGQQGENGEADRRAQECEPENREDDDHAEDEVASVHARVLEDGRHPEERRVRVRELNVLLGEDLRVRPGLIDADRREDRGHRDERRRERTPRPVPWPGERDDREQEREREVEEDERDRPRAWVLRPEKRNPRKGDERRGRYCDQVWDGRKVAASEDAVGKRESRGDEDTVERDEEEGLLVPETDREAKRRRQEQGDRGRRGIADEDESEPEPEDGREHEGADARRRLRQQARRVRDEGICEADLGRDQRRQAGEEEDALPREQEPARSEGPNHRCGVRQGLVVHRPRRSAGE